ncbi:hypothetical protein EK21DRAFT_80278, partial [Setomelanomma holmii]
KNVKATFAASTLFLFNLDRMINSVPKPAVYSTKLVVGKVIVALSLQEEALQTPVIPALTEDLMSLRNLIAEQDAHALNEKSKQSLHRHLLKLPKAAQISFAKEARIEQA